MKTFKRFNIIIGWIVFAISTAVYFLTLEPTASLWDCGEFIATAYKLEIGHPPGAPFFMLFVRFVTLFAPGKAEVALFANGYSGVASALTVMFLFWTITHLGRKFICKDGHFSTDRLIALFGSAFVGATAFMFSDTFWFSAVEGEVYASAAFFTAITFWAILKWEDEPDRRYANRWFFLISMLVGIAVGIHLLGLLVIPAIAMTFYFKKYKPTSRGIIKALLISFAILGGIMFVLIPLFLNGAAYFDLLFVNTFNLPFNTGVLTFIALLAVLLIWGIHYAQKTNRVTLHTGLISLTLFLMCYCAYAMIIIRSSADPPLDENNPESIHTLISYLNREQYGERPIFKGPYYNAPVIDVKQGKPKYAKRDGKYKVIGHHREHVYSDKFTTIFPRMYSRRGKDKRGYKKWVDIDGKAVSTRNGKTRKKPSFADNLEFFFKYQLGHMYFRYFMWNFSGRQNDIQGHGGPLKGNWITGINVLDEMRLGPQDNMPDSIKEHPAHNTYYMLPFLLGLLGLFYHYSRQKKDFSVVLLLFFMTGIAIILYLNQPPFEPRERDYTYAGSFYAFSIWIGFGVLAIYEFFRQKIPKVISPILATLLCFALVPAIMGAENWDDHDRSGRYATRAHAYNYLNSCAPNAILFTNGDNDTFPLWYLQEVEGIRTDVRVVNLMLLNMDWHIEEAKRKAYESDPLPITLEKEKYQGSTNNQVPVMNRIDDHVELERIMNFFNSDKQKTKRRTRRNKKLDYIPTQQFKLPVDSAYIMENNIIDPALADDIVPSIKWEINKKRLSKSDLVVLDILAHNDWERPVYFVSPGRGNSLGLGDYMQLEGYAYRLVPVKTKAKNMMSTGMLATDTLYDNLMNEFKWGRMNKKDVYLGHYHRRTLKVLRLRNKFHRLAQGLMKAGRMDSAEAVLDTCVKRLPHHNYPYNYHMNSIIRDYYELEANQKANKLVEQFSDIKVDELSYYLRLRQNTPNKLRRPIQKSYQILKQLINITKNYGETKLSDSINMQLEQLGLGIQQGQNQQQQRRRQMPPMQ